MRQQPFLETRDEDDGELQALGRVDGHERHCVGRALEIVHVRDQRDIHKEACQPLALVELVVARSLRQQLLDVLQPLLVPGLPQPFAVAAVIEHALAQPGDGTVHRGPKALDEPPEHGHGLPSPGAEPLDLVAGCHGGPERCVVVLAPLLEQRDGPLADPAGRAVHDPRQAQTVPLVDAHTQIGHQVLDLLAAVELDGADDAVRHRCLHEPLLEAPRLRVGAVEGGEVAPLPPVGVALADLAHHDVGLAGSVVAEAEADGHTLLVLRPHAALVALRVVLDHAVGPAQDGRGRAEVLLEHDHLGVRVVLREAKDVPDVRPAPAVDRLVGVPCGAEVAVLGGQPPRDEVLRAVRVLVLVDEDELEPPLPPVAELGVTLERQCHVHQQVVEIECRIRGEQPLVGGVDLGHELLAEPVGLLGKLLRVPELSLGAADAVERGSRRERAADVEAVHRLLHRLELVVAVVYGEVAVEPERLARHPQHPGAQRVEGGHPCAARAREALDPLSHLARRLVGERHGHDAKGRDALAAQAGHAAGDDAGLAAPCPRHDQQRPLDVGRRLALRVGQTGEDRFNVLHWKPPLGNRPLRCEILVLRPTISPAGRRVKSSPLAGVGRIRRGFLTA